MKICLAFVGTLAKSARPLALAAVVAMMTLAARADYTFLVEGDPEVAARAAAVSSVKSSGISLETRIRSIMKSIGQALNSNDWSGLILIVR